MKCVIKQYLYDLLTPYSVSARMFKYRRLLIFMIQYVWIQYGHIPLSKNESQPIHNT